VLDTAVAERLRPFLAAPDRAAVLTDFDGTLAPIVTDPAAAVALPGTEEVLISLAARYGAVGVVSGRPVSYLVSRLGDAAGAVHLRGLYGIERSDGGVVTVDPAAAPYREPLAAIADRAEREAPAGATVERKGFAVTLHVRAAPQAAGWLQDFVDREVAAVGLVVHPGRMSVEIRPPVDADKGSVVRELGAGRAAVCFLGDDVGDLPAFAALAELRAGGASTLGVAVASDESPPELADAADVVVPDPGGALAVLRRLAAG
jgi:trehalose 6-phosphate phosphatase